jgi:hypothetical protein
MYKHCKRICITKICALDIKFSANVSNIRRHADTQSAYFLKKRIKLHCLLALLILDKIYIVDLKSFFVIHVPWNTKKNSWHYCNFKGLSFKKYRFKAVAKCYSLFVPVLITSTNMMYYLKHSIGKAIETATQSAGTNHGIAPAALHACI